MNRILLPSFSSQGNPGANGLPGAKGAAVSIWLQHAAVAFRVCDGRCLSLPRDGPCCLSSPGPARCCWGSRPPWTPGYSWPCWCCWCYGCQRTCCKWLWLTFPSFCSPVPTLSSSPSRLPSSSRLIILFLH